jgi:stringent starvation protein B
MGNEWIEFTARFSGKAHKIEIPVANVLAIYARENGQGMAFQVDAVAGEGEDSGTFDEDADTQEQDAQRGETSSALDSADDGANEEPSEGADEPPKSDGDGSKGGSRPRLKIVK